MITMDDVQKAVNSMRQQGREPMAHSIALDFGVAHPERGFLRPKGNSAAGQLTAGGPTTKARLGTNGDYDGASHTIKATRAPQVAEAAPTQANGRIVPPTHRSGKNFWSQA